jgi:hypothetical protein
MPQFHRRSLALFADVEKLALEGRPVPVAPGSWVRIEYARRELRNLGMKTAARLDRNKRKFALFAATTATSTVAAVAVAAATGPGAAGIPVAIVSTVAVATVGAGVGIAVGRVWRFAKAQVQTRIHIKKWDDRRKEEGRQEDGLIRGQRRDDEGFVAVDQDYARILDAVTYMLQYEGLSAIQDSFAIMEREHAEAEKRMARGAPVADCADAIRLWEALARVRYEYDRVRNVFELFDEFVVWLVMDRSRMEDEFDRHLKATWPQFVASTDWARLGLLNDAANAGGVFHTAFRDLGRREDYTAFVFQSLPAWTHADLAQSAPPAMAAAAQRSGFGRVAGAGAKGAVLGGVKAGASGGLSLGAKLGWTAASTAVSRLPTTVAAEVGKTAATGAVSLGAGVAAGAVNTALTAAVEEANNVWNDFKLKNKKTLGLKGLRDQTTLERIGTLRSEVKNKKIAKFVTKWKHLRESHAVFLREGVGDPAAYAVRLLRRQKHWYQTLGEDQLAKYVFEFHETVVAAANRMSDRVDAWAAEAQPRIDAWISDHGDHAICAGHCYNSRTVVPAGARLSAGDEDAVPVRPIGAKVRLEQPAK